MLNEENKNALRSTLAYLSQNKRIFLAGIVFLISFLSLFLVLVRFKKPLQIKQRAQTTGTIYYVSKNGNNTDGLSWKTAWNELDQIDWNLIRPGDTIFIDGGSTSKVYTSTLTIKTDGAINAPITIMLSTEAGRNGQAIIFGGRSIPLPYCHQKEYSYQTDGVRARGINIDNHKYITIDGTKLRGIVIYGHNYNGIQLNVYSSNIILRNLEIYDNGQAVYHTNSSTTDLAQNTWYSDRQGLGLAGSNHALDRLIIRDNGQDSIQQVGYKFPINNVILKNSWLYNERKDPSGQVWNYCVHPDGIQIYGGGDSYNIAVADSVIGPGFMHGVLLGDSSAVVHNVTIRNSLFFGAGNLNISTNSKITKTANNWLIENVTSDKPNRGYGNILFKVPPGGDGSQLRIRNSILTGGYRLDVPTNGNYDESNYYYGIQTATDVGIETDPRYTHHNSYGAISLEADFSLAPSSPAAGKGSKITSVAQLLSMLDSNQKPIDIPPKTEPTKSPATTTPMLSPAPTLKPKPSPTITTSPSMAEQIPLPIIEESSLEIDLQVPTVSPFDSLVLYFNQILSFLRSFFLKFKFIHF
jgi:hypothetical protein